MTERACLPGEVGVPPRLIRRILQTLDAKAQAQEGRVLRVHLIVSVDYVVVRYVGDSDEILETQQFPVR